MSLLLFRQKGILAHDQFTRADSTSSLGTSESGHVWTARNGTWGISSNKGYAPAVTGAQSTADVDGGRANVSVAVDYTYQSNNGGLVARVVDFSNHILLHVSSTSQIRLTKKVADSFTTLANGSASFSTGNTYNLRAECRGATILAYVDGVLKITHTLSATDQATFLTPTRFGLRTTAVGTERFDNFVIRRA